MMVSPAFADPRAEALLARLLSESGALAAAVGWIDGADSGNLRRGTPALQAIATEFFDQ